MKALVVYESLWGNTSSIASAIGEGLGEGTPVLSTEAAASDLLDGVDLIVVGAPIHILNLPSAKTRQQIVAGAYGPPPSPPDLSHPPLRDWLARLPRGDMHFAAFETGVNAWYGHGAATKAAKALQRVGYRQIAKPMRFNVTGRPMQPTAFGMLCEGELDRARQWGELLAAAMERQ
jgi:hypothetical protein